MSQSDSRGSIQRVSIEGVDQKSPNKDGFTKRRDDRSNSNIAAKSVKPDPISTQKSEDPGRERPTYVLPGFAYSVVDLFENEHFNMVYVLKRSENDMKVINERKNIENNNLRISSEQTT